ncbi:MAG: UDP-N-acetylmuramoyl-tripeptide--D-alanyl-D-alanine ligase [Alphaproteobacteria bacterium]|nr:UDP-N-acetylmuramoyl-tripeptide--D-alanyl-D-alanine ligase [Alphaproteobacteria bacterium]
MSVLWSRDDALAATGGQAQGPDWRAMGVSIDTRTLMAGDLFVALKDVRDGHDFVADALQKGAAAALVSRRPDGVGEDAPLLIVKDVQDALEALGIAARARTGAHVIAITGSVGKTSTKEMLRDVLAGQGRVHAAEASYNNHWGVPLTLARMPVETDFAVIEIGMNHPGEIAPLARQARPHVAIVTSVAAAHLEAFDDIEGIAREKASIFDGLEPGGTAIYNMDVDTSPILRAAAEEHAETVLGFGATDGAAMRLDDLTLTDTSSVVRGRFLDEKFLFKVAAPGRHFAMNALAVLAAARVAGADFDVAACDIAQWRPPAGRGTRETIALDPVEDHEIDLIDDAFNANPASMAASLEVLAATRPVDDIGRIARGRRIAVLGDMLELGPDEEKLHAEIADHPAMADITLVHCVGPRMAALWDALPETKRGHKAARAEDLAARAHGLIDAGDVVLVKGSKGSRVSVVVDAIRKLGHPRPTND